MTPFRALLLTLLLAPPGATIASGTEPLHEFTEAGGCKLRGSPTSVARQKEIAARGLVAWDGRCVGGYIDGPGTLRHQGTDMDNGRARRFAFYLTGVARAGLRTGEWRRESYNRFEDSPKYWTSMATLNYVGGVARGAAKFRPVRDNADFSPPFRQLLVALDRELATAGAAPPAAERASAPPAAAATPPAPAPATSTVPLAPPPAGAATPPPPARPPSPAVAVAPAPAAPSPAAPTPAPPPPATPSPVARSPAAPAPAAPTPVAASPVAASPAAPSPAVPTAPTPSAPEKPRSLATLSLSRPTSPGDDTRDTSLKLLAAPGTVLPAPAPPALPQQRILEQRGACAVDSINGHAVGEHVIDATASQALFVAGWAADPQKPHSPEPPQIPSAAWIRFYDRGGGPGLLIEMPRNAARPDVARALGHPAYARAGFRVTLDPGRLKAGDYTVSIVQRIGADLAICGAIGRLSLR